MNNACGKNKNYEMGCHPSFTGVRSIHRCISSKRKFVMWEEILAIEMKYLLKHSSKVCWHLNKYKNGRLGLETWFSQ